MIKTVIITGANSGLGFEASKQILQQGSDYHLIMACRNLDKAAAARAEIMLAVPDAHITCMELDTSSLAKVRAFANAFTALNVPLYGLICNAGVAGISVHETADGFNSIFETNYLGHFLLTQLLLPSMVAGGRIITVSSDRHDLPGMTWPGAAALAHCGQDEQLDRASYSYSKLCLILFTYELERQLAAAGKQITVNTVNPGLMIETGLAKNKARFTPEFLARFQDIRSTAKDSARMLTDLLCGDEFAQGPAKYYDRSSAQPIPSSQLSYDQQVARELWDYSMRAVGLSK